MSTTPTAVDRAADWEVTEPECPEPPEPPELFPTRRSAHTTTPAHPPVTANPSPSRLDLRRRSARRPPTEPCVSEKSVAEAAGIVAVSASALVPPTFLRSSSRAAAGSRSPVSATSTGCPASGSRPMPRCRPMPRSGSASRGGRPTGSSATSSAPSPAAASSASASVPGSIAVAGGSTASGTGMRGIRTVERTSCTRSSSSPVVAPQPGQDTAPFRCLRQVVQ